MTDTANLETRLAEVLAPELGSVEVIGLHRLKGGYSREMWSFDLHTTDRGTIPLILCADSPVGVVGEHRGALGREREALLLHHLHGRGLPVPDAIAAGGADGALGRPYLVMERHPGTTAVGPFRRDKWYLGHRDRLAGQLAALLALVHGADVPEAILGPRPEPSAVGPDALARWTAELEDTPSARSTPIDHAVDWLGTHLPPPPDRVVLVHGDFRIGNILHGRDGDRPDGLWTLLDWEMAHYGDALEDVAWAQLICWRVGTGRVGGLVSLDRWAQLYAEAATHGVDPRALQYWEVLGTVKMTCLIHRAVDVVEDEHESVLLRSLASELADELDRRLLAGAR